MPGPVLRIVPVGQLVAVAASPVAVGEKQVAVRRIKELWVRHAAFALTRHCGFTGKGRDVTGKGRAKIHEWNPVHVAG